MTNIPTDLLRTLVAVADLRSFTRAALSLGVTQPAVSAQIKRLQALLGSDLFDRRTPGVSLTLQGEKVVAYARRMLSINDQIVSLDDEAQHPERVIRIGVPGDFLASIVSTMVAEFRVHRPGARFVVSMNTHEPLIRDLRQGDLDIVVTLSVNEPVDTRHGWPEEMCWVCSPNTKIDVDKPIPLVSYSEKSIYHFLAAGALKKAGFACDDVFICPSLLGLSGAIAAGLGVMAMPRRRVAAFGLVPWDEGPLPKLRDTYCGIFVREGEAAAPLQDFADAIAEILRPNNSNSPGEFGVFAPSHKLVKALNSAA